MSAPTWRIQYVNHVCALVSGYGTREAIRELTGRAPVWSSLSRAWITTPIVAADLVALAERKRRTVVVLDEEQPDLFGGVG